jgi:hypothetical protein
MVALHHLETSAWRERMVADAQLQAFQLYGTNLELRFRERMMSLKIFMLTALAASAVLAGCSQNERATSRVQSHLTVVGSQDGVERFAELQGALRPALAVSAIKPHGSGRAEAVVALPVGFSGRNLVHTTREALAAGLSYKFEERQSVETVPS